MSEQTLGSEIWRMSAAEAVERLRWGEVSPLELGGLPVAINNQDNVAGVRTTYGAPEFGARASTFNDIFGKTRNPWNLEKSVAGSSGGLAAALLEAEIGLAARLPLDPRPGRTGL